MEQLIFNKTCVCNSPIAGKEILVRTGSSPFNDKDPFTSLLSSLLHANNKKFSNLSDSERNEQNKKLKENIMKRIKNGDQFKLTISSFFENIQGALSKFHEYLHSDDLTDLICESNKKFCAKLLNNGDHSKIELFTILFEIISLNNFKKIFRIVEKKWVSFCVNDYTKLLQKETIRFFMYQDIFEEIEKEKSDFFIKNIIYLINVLVQICFEKVCKNEKNFLTDNVTQGKVDILSEYLENNIVFIDSEHRQPFFAGSSSEIVKSRKTVIILSFEMKHFEIVGVLLKDKRIIRTFLSNEEIVQNITHLISVNDVIVEPKVKDDDEQKSEEEIFDVNDIKENLNYNSDDEMLSTLGDEP